MRFPRLQGVLALKETDQVVVGFFRIAFKPNPATWSMVSIHCSSWLEELLWGIAWQKLCL